MYASKSSAVAPSMAKFFLKMILPAVGRVVGLIALELIELVGHRSVGVGGQHFARDEIG